MTYFIFLVHTERSDPATLAHGGAVVDASLVDALGLKTEQRVRSDTLSVKIVPS